MQKSITSYVVIICENSAKSMQLNLNTYIVQSNKEKKINVENT